ncbi:hypothetical protein [Prochlorococcus sp. MIT 1223]|uniref:hypothetical protein n=1 Tax=Prochlorococcus sp. MIT 1223 TaxID=3096217 RepID=UPI002A747D79|nr:hypothetical protein [Prochlorococcus sp. MIT 1223]
MRTSPLYSYWQTNQNELDEEERLLMVNEEDVSSSLFKNEPYKWENLYQSIIREICNGDKSAINGLLIVLNTVKEDYRERIILSLRDEKIFDEETLDLLNSKKKVEFKKKYKTLRFLRILFAIFTNPYCIKLNRKKHHLYEKTGAFFFSIRKLF